MPLSTTSSNTLSPFMFPISVGRLCGTSLGAGALTTLAVTAGVLYACPIFVSTTTTLTAIGIEVTTGATGNVKLGMYLDSSGTPGALRFDAGAVSTATPAAFKSIAISQVLTPAWYWLAGVFSATPTVRALTTANSLHLLGFSSGTDTVIHTGVSVAFSYAALPDPFTGGSTLAAVNFPRFMLQA